jgi:murein DD-endopeptidase MepM/ murein hydrolase activator NlpD
MGYNMSRKKIALLIAPILAIVLVLGYSFVMGISIGFDSPSLDFPISEEDKVAQLSAYHTPDWGEPGVFHNGIDLVISDNVTIVSPVRGTIVSYSENINPYAGNVLFEIAIAINWGWDVHLVLEPGFRDATNNSLQSTLIDAIVGQQVSIGDELATLLFSDNYPHLHYMLLNLGADVCAYNYSTSQAQGTFNDIATDTNSTILFPYLAPNPITSPITLIIIGGFVVYLLGVMIIFRPRK